MLVNRITEKLYRIRARVRPSWTKSGIFQGFLRWWILGRFPTIKTKIPTCEVGTDSRCTKNFPCVFCERFISFLWNQKNTDCSPCFHLINKSEL